MAAAEGGRERYTCSTREALEEGQYKLIIKDSSRRTYARHICRQHRSRRSSWAAWDWKVVHHPVCIPGHERPFLPPIPAFRLSLSLLLRSTSIHTKFAYTHSLSPMAPSPQNPALDVPPKDAKQALAEDKYDDCMSCRVTGTFRNCPLCDQYANIKVQGRPHSLASECTAITRACRIYGSRRRPS